MYVKDRDDLLNQMFDAAVAEVQFEEEPDPKRWREQLERLLTEMRVVMERYSGIAWPGGRFDRA